MSEPVHIAAIDAGSNAVRLAVARAYSALDIEPLYDERYSLRLGEGVFVRHVFSEKLLKKSVKAFRDFKETMEEFGVTKYRAVATSASREARNREPSSPPSVRKRLHAASSISAAAAWN
jgi:exopolyphosphatase/guanosine-5'-triphosphate,3'-diphosphate pyrophosphatase